MDIVVLMLVHGALFITHYPQSVTGIVFTSNPARVVKGDTGSGRLTMKCSANEGDIKRVYSIKIKRETFPGSNQFQLFASFVQNTATNVDEAKLDDQITNNRKFIVSGDKSGRPPYLQVTMSIQKMYCSDARLYSCDYAYDSNSYETLIFRQNATLEVFMLPSMTSLQGRKNGQLVDGGSLSNKAEFNIGDLLQLTCEAAIGSINSTKIRWERSSETGSGYITASGVAYTISDGTALSDGQCGYTRTSTLTLNVTASDSYYPLSFQCYVTVSGYPTSSSTPGGSYTTSNNLEYHLAVVTGIVFTSNPARVVKGDTGSERLTLKCAVSECDVKMVYSIKIQRETSPGSNQFQLFASFEYNPVTNLDAAKLDDQITNNREFIVSGDKSGSPPYLQVTMNTQTIDCNDARIYSCDYTFESNSDQTFSFRQNATLEVFVLPSMTSLQGRKNGQLVDGGSLSNKAEFNIGDLLQLTCEAAIGSINSTKIRWGRSSETGSGYITASGVAYTISDGTALSDGQCGYTRISTLTFNVTASDSNNPLSFQCYVTVSGYPSSSFTASGSYTTSNNLQFHLAVECPKDTFGEDCSGQCYCEVGTCTHSYGICPGKCRSGYRGSHCNEAGSEVDNKSLIIGVTAGATVTVLVIAAISGFVVYRSRHKNRSSGNNVYTTADLYVTPTETPEYDTLDNANDIRGSENNIYENEEVTGF